MSDSLPISCVRTLQVPGENTNDTELHNLNGLLTKNESLKESTNSENISDRSVNENCQSDVSLFDNQRTEKYDKIKNKVIEDLNVTLDSKITKAENNKSDLFHKYKESEFNTIKAEKKWISCKEGSTNETEIKLHSSNLGSMLHSENGDFSENIYEPSDVEFSNEAHSLQSNKGLMNNVYKSLNGLKDDITCNDIEVPKSIGDKIKVIPDSTLSIIKEKQLGNISSPQKSFKRLLDVPYINENIVDSDITDEVLTKMNSSHCKYPNIDNRESDGTRKEIYSCTNDGILENKLDMVDDRSIYEAEESNILAGQKDVAMNCTKEKSALNTLCNRDNLQNKTCEIEASCKLTDSENDAVILNSITSSRIVESTDRVLCRKEMIKINSQDDVNLCLLPNSNNYLVESSDHNNSSMKRETASNDRDNMCIICQKEVKHLYYHAVLFHSCCSFIPVKYMRSYQRHLSERSPNIHENYMYSLPGEAMYICKKCGILLKSIDDVRIHLNIHSDIYAVHYLNGDDCSCYNMNVINKVLYISSLLIQSKYKCFLCQQYTSCEVSLYKHLKVVHFSNNFCQKCSTSLAEGSSNFLEHNTSHSSMFCETIEYVTKDYYHISWNVLYNSLNSLDGREYQLNLSDQSSDDRSVVFPIKINSLEEFPAITISPSTLMKKYIDSKFMWKQTLHNVSNYASLAFDVYIQIMLSKKLLSLKRKKKQLGKKSTLFLASLKLKQLCRFSKRKSAVVAMSRDIKQNSKIQPIALIKNSLADVVTPNDDAVIKETELNDLVEISGEWSNKFTFMCCSCGVSFNCLTDIMDHKWLEHPAVWCAHTMLKGNEQVPKMFSQQFLPSINHKIVKEATLKELHGNVENVNVKCTKCKESILVSEFCSHAAECGNLNEEVTIKKKCRKLLKLQSHKGQRMSSRYSASFRNSYKNIEESKMSRSNGITSSCSNSKSNIKNKTIVNNETSSNNSKIKHKTVPSRCPKSKKKTATRRKKCFNMKLRCAVKKKPQKSVKEIVPNVKMKVDVHKVASKVRMKLQNKIIQTESILKDNKSPKIIKNTSSIKNSKHYKSANKIFETLNIGKKSSKVFEINKKSESKPKKKRKPQKSWNVRKCLSDFEDDLSESENKNIYVMKRRDGLRARKDNVKKSIYSLRKKSDQIELDFKNTSEKESNIVSNANESVMISNEKESVMVSNEKESVVVSSPKESINVNNGKELYNVNTGKELIVISSPKESINVDSGKELNNVNNGKESNIVSSIKETTKARGTKDLLSVSSQNNSLKAKNVKESLNVRRVKELLKVSKKKELLKVSKKKEPLKVSKKKEPLKSISLTESVKINCGKELMTNIGQEKSPIDVCPNITKPLLKANAVKSHEVKTAKVCLNVISEKELVEMGSVGSQNTDIRKKSLKTRITRESLEANVGIKCKRQNSVKEAVKFKLNDISKNRKRKIHLDENKESEESLGFPHKKRKYNIGDEIDIISPVINKKVKPCHIKTTKSKILKAAPKTSFGKFLKNFKQKSQNITKLSHSRKFADFKMLYDLTEQKIRSEIPKCEQVINSHSVEKVSPFKLSHEDENTQPVSVNSKGNKCKKSVRFEKCIESPSTKKITKNTVDYSNNKVQKTDMKSIAKTVKKIFSKRRKNRRKITDTDVFNASVDEELEIEGHNIASNRIFKNINFEEETLENKLSEKKQDSSKSVRTVSTSSNNCVINISPGKDSHIERKRKNVCKENSFTRKERKLSNKSGISDISLEDELLCSDCGLTFDSISSKDDHKFDCKNIALEMSIMADEKLFECPHCQLTFAKAGTHKKHTSSCRARKSRKSSKLSSKLVKNDIQRNEVKINSLVSNENKKDNILPQRTSLPNLNGIADCFKNYCLTHIAASQVCSLLYSCSLSTTELRNCLCDSTSLENSCTIVQPKSNTTSANVNNFSTLKILLDQPASTDFVDILYEVMLSIKANSYIKMKDMDKSFMQESEIPPILIEASRSDLLKTLSAIEEYLKQAEELETNFQKEKMLRDMKLTFEAGTCS